MQRFLDAFHDYSDSVWCSLVAVLLFRIDYLEPSKGYFSTAIVMCGFAAIMTYSIWQRRRTEQEIKRRTL